MQNVFDIKRDKKLNFILPLGKCRSHNESLKVSALIVIHLFYLEKLETYLKYINNIPNYINILFITPNIQIEMKIDSYMQNLNIKYKVILKRNRGRDVSALLVASRTEILQYKYVCFIHDKQEKSEYTKRDTEIFERCLWENMIGSIQYINNIISEFEENAQLGVLLPPESISDNFSFFFKNTWDQDFDLMQLLAEKLKLKCDLNKEKKPLSLGTVFWARVDALKKIFENPWKYEDFDEEPLAPDGTISHAIERCFAYVAQDAGYDTGIVMTDQFAGERIDYLQEIMTLSFAQMEELLNISSIYQLKRTKLVYKGLIEFAERFSPIYIYGAGSYGKRCAKILQTALYQIKGFIVSDIENTKKKIGNIPVIQVSELGLEKNSGIIIAVSDKFRSEIEEKIKEKFPLFKDLFYFGF